MIERPEKLELKILLDAEELTSCGPRQLLSATACGAGPIDIQHVTPDCLPQSRRVQTSEQVLRVPLQGADEFLLVEFRDKIGFDLALPAAGVLIYHMEPGRAYPCADADCERLYPFYIVEADGRGDLLRTSLEGGNIGEASDMFGATGPVGFTNHTNPATHLNSGEESTVNFYRIAIEGGVANISLSTSPTSVDRLVEPFLQGGAVPLTDPEKDFLDAIGNDNGRYDVGDLRARLLR